MIGLVPGHILRGVPHLGLGIRFQHLKTTCVGVSGCIAAIRISNQEFSHRMGFSLERTQGRFTA